MVYVNFRVLAAALADAAKFVGVDSPLKLVQHIRLSVAEKTLVIRATNLEVAYERRLAVHTREDVSFVGSIPPKALKSLPFDPDLSIQLSVNGTDTVFSDTDASVEVPPTEGSQADFDVFDLWRVDPDNGLLEKPIAALGPVEAGRFARAMAFVLHAAATEDNRPILTGIHLTYGEGRIRLEAADGYRIHHAEFEAPVEGNGDLIIPAKALEKWASVAALGNGLILKRRHGRAEGLVIETSQDRWIALAIEGQFPNTASIYPESYAQTASINVSEWVPPLKKLKTFRPVSETTQWAVEFPVEWRADTVTPFSVLGIADTGARLTVKLPATWAYADVSRWKFGLNGRYVLEAVQGLADATKGTNVPVTLHLCEEKRPVLFDITVPDDLTLSALVMPLTINR